MTVCESDKCTGCMLCVEACKKNAIAIQDTRKTFNAVIDKTKCVDCNLCHNLCPQNNVPKKTSPASWYQGWNNDETTRDSAPSGGVGMALIRYFISTGGYVCSCTFTNGEFVFRTTNKLEDANMFSGSKYVKSNPFGAYSKVLELLKGGQKVLFIGLPCQVAAVKNYVPEQYLQQLYLVDLICHGTPSPKLLNDFLHQYGKDLSDINDMKFRLKAKMQLVVDDEGIVCKGVSDKYTIAFLNGLTYTQNCYSCNYASEERVSDITIGDSWGSCLPAADIKKGISLMLVQSEKGKELLESADIKLMDVDIDNAKAHNGQLVSPMKQPAFYDDFFSKLDNKKLNGLIFRRYMYDCLKQDMKYILLKIGVVR